MKTNILSFPPPDRGAWSRLAEGQGEPLKGSQESWGTGKEDGSIFPLSSQCPKGLQPEVQPMFNQGLGGIQGSNGKSYRKGQRGPHMEPLGWWGGDVGKALVDEPGP